MRRVAAAAGCAALLVSACTSAGPPQRVTGPVAPSPSSGNRAGTHAQPRQAHRPAPRRDHAGTIWLCRPGIAHNPCSANLTTTSINSAGVHTVQHATAARRPPIDCFYVYPTVSKQRRINATRRVQSAEIKAAIAQASRFSQVCRVYAPMYPQLTLSAIATGGNSATAAGAIKAYSGVLAAWQDYLRNFNHGRGIVLLGHSQGSFLLTALLQRAVDNVPAVRKLLVSAILPGGNITVAAGRRTGGAFAHIPSCRTAHETGCVIAYSSFDSPPGPDALFGRADTSIGRQLGLGGPESSTARVLCVNPAALDTGSHRLSPYFPRALGQTPGGVRTPWVTFPGEYRASCRHGGGANWLQVDRVSSTDPRPAVYASLGQTWGLHTFDVNLALGNLVHVVAREGRAYAH